MPTTQTPPLPSARRLMAAAVSASVAAVVLVIAVLPAEYGIAPPGWAPDSVSFSRHPRPTYRERFTRVRRARHLGRSRTSRRGRDGGVTAFNEYAPIARVLLRSPRDAFRDAAHNAAEWQSLNFTSPPHIDLAAEQHAACADTLRQAGAAVALLTAPGLTLDSIYVRDASIVTPRGMVLCRMGKPARRDTSGFNSSTRR